MLKPLMIAAVYTANPTAQGAVTGLAAWNFDGAARNFTTMFANIVGILMSSIVSICAAVFLTGAFLYIIGSFGKEDLKSNGKNMMIGSLIALLIVQLARAIVAVTLLFLYWGSL
ncbi:MAG: hypothetical protein AAB544_01755 [Patescibacteria group bacterium]